jgi:cellulose synthase/poly-beta-1,6-N-acetylglucosamine synthase-like glycosyltransferase
VSESGAPVRPSSEPPAVSIIVPCRNEERFIAACLDSILASDYPRDRLEVLVVDGQSDDATRDIVADYCRRFPFVRLISNPGRVTPAALNLGVAQAKGEIIMRMDAHSAYPPSYVPTLVSWLERSGADNVGGSCQALPAGDSVRARAIAVGLAHPFGVGNSRFRLGTSTARWVETVPFGCYRRSVFDRIGGFDEALVRNQDDEFNYRLIRRGGRILLVPGVVVGYYVRDSLRKLARMYYQYGYFKPLVIRKVGSIMTLRQLVPSLFVLGLGASALLSLWHPAWALLGGALLAAYVLAALVSAATVVRRHGLGTAGMLMVVFAVIHVCYGVGFLNGAARLLIPAGSATPDPAGVPLSR